MNSALLLKLHRWTTLVFALPLAAIILTGLVLSVEPMVQTLSIKDGSLDASRVDVLLRRYDPDAEARGLSLDPYNQRLRLQGGPEIDLTTDQVAASPSGTAGFFLWTRRTHERLLGQEWLVVTSTIAMLVLMLLGILMGLPRLRASLAGWHKGVAWFTLPVLVLSPLTGLLMAFGVTLQGEGPPRGGRPLPLREAVQVVARSYDPSRLLSLGPRGGRFMARIDDAGTLRTFQVTAQGLTELPRNWPRLLHEGNWSSVVGGGVNLIVSLASVTLMATGLVLWGRRTLRWRRQRPASQEGRYARPRVPAR